MKDSKDRRGASYEVNRTYAQSRSVGMAEVGVSPEDVARRGSDSHAEELAWIAGHCRFVRTNLPRGELGVSFAEELLAALPEACRRRVPDLTGTAPELLRMAVDYGLLTEVPSPRVIRAVPRLLKGLTPAIEARGGRHWTLWVVHLLDPRMQAKIRRLTPESQLIVCGPTTEKRPGSRAELVEAYREARASLAEEEVRSATMRALLDKIEGLLPTTDGEKFHSGSAQGEDIVGRLRGVQKCLEAANSRRLPPQPAASKENSAPVWTPEDSRKYVKLICENLDLKSERERQEKALKEVDDERRRAQEAVNFLGRQVVMLGRPDLVTMAKCRFNVEVKLDE